MDELITVGKLAIALFFLGIVVAFSPTIVMTELAIIAKSKNPLVASLALIGGVTSAIVLLVALWLFAIDPYQEIRIPTTRDVLLVAPVLDIFAGIALIWGSKKLIANRDSQDKSVTSDKTHDTIRPISIYWFSFLKMITSLSTIGATLLAVRLLKSNVDGGIWLILATLWLLVVAIAPFLYLLLLRITKPDKFNSVISATKKFEGIDWRLIISRLMLWCGIFLIVFGLYSA